MFDTIEIDWQLTSIRFGIHPFSLRSAKVFIVWRNFELILNLPASLRISTRVPLIQTLRIFFSWSLKKQINIAPCGTLGHPVVISSSVHTPPTCRPNHALSIDDWRGIEQWATISSPYLMAVWSPLNAYICHLRVYATRSPSEIRFAKRYLKTERLGSTEHLGSMRRGSLGHWAVDFLAYLHFSVRLLVFFGGNIQFFWSWVGKSIDDISGQFCTMSFKITYTSHGRRLRF